MEELKRNVKERLMSRDRKHLNKLLGNISEYDRKNTRFLISINVPGSVGPLRFLANHNDAVSTVIRGALKRYAREGRIPAIGSNAQDFLLCRAYTGFDALNPGAAIGDCGGRDFVLCKKRWPEMGRAEVVGAGGRGGGACCKEWMFQSLIRRIWKGSSSTSRVGVQEAAVAAGSTAFFIKLVTPPAVWIQASGNEQESNSSGQICS